MNTMNTLSRIVTVVGIGLISLWISGTAQAAKIKVFSTGVYTFRNSIDQYWSLNNSAAHVMPNNRIPSGWFQKNTKKAKWVFPGHRNVSNSLYVYKQTFDLSGLDPSTANLSGLISSDNEARIFLNGIDTRFTTPSRQWRYRPKAFNLTNGFVDGLNTLEVRVNNRVADTGLYVDITSAVANSKSVPGKSVPEPLTILGSATALGFGALLKREHSKKQKKS